MEVLCNSIIERFDVTNKNFQSIIIDRLHAVEVSKSFEMYVYDFKNRFYVILAKAK